MGRDLTWTLVLQMLFSIMLVLLYQPVVDGEEEHLGPIFDVLRRNSVKPSGEGARAFLFQMIPKKKPSTSLDRLVKKLSSENYQERKRATKKLRELAPRVTERLQKAIRSSEDPETRTRIQEILTHLEQDQFKPLLMYAAVRAYVESRDRVPATDLLTLVPRIGSSFVYEAVRTACLGVDADQLKPFREALRSPLASRRRLAITVLGRHLPEAKLGPVVESLKSEREAVRFSAARILVQRNDPRALPVLVRLLESDQEKFRRVSFYQLQQMSGKTFGVKSSASGVSNASMLKWMEWTRNRGAEALEKTPVVDYSARFHVLETARKGWEGAGPIVSEAFRKKIRLVGNQFPVQQVQTKHGSAKPQKHILNAYGKRLSLIRFTVPDDQERDLVWTFSCPEGMIHDWGFISLEKKKLRKRQFKSYPLMGAQEASRQISYQLVSSEYLKPGRTYGVWFLFHDAMTDVYPCRVAMNMVPTGRVQNSIRSIAEAVGPYLSTGPARNFVTALRSLREHLSAEEDEKMRKKLKKVMEMARQLGRKKVPLSSVLVVKGKRAEKKGRFKEAKRIYQRVKRIREQAFGTHHQMVADVYKLLGMLYLKQGDLWAAKAYMRMNLDRFYHRMSLEKGMSSRTAEKHNNYGRLGLIHVVQEDWEEAERTFRKAVEVNSNQLLGYIGRWVVTASQVGWEEAETILTDYLKTRGKRFDQTFGGKLVSYLLGRIETKAFISSIDQHEGNLSSAHFWIGMKQELKGNRSEAVQAYQKSVKTQVIRDTEHIFATLRLRALKNRKPLLGKKEDRK